jgi:signal transduction histidine kinase
MKLTQRLSLTHGFIALLAVVVTLGVMIGGARLLFWNEVHSSQRRQMNDFALQARESYFGHEDVGNCNFIRQAVKDETVAFVSFVDILNRPRLVLPTTFHDQDFSEGDRTLEDGRKISVLALPVEAGGQKVGTVSIGYDNAKLEARVRAQMARWMGLGAVGGLAAISVAILVSFFLARHLVRPLKRIRAGTQEVRLGKLDKMVEVDRSDEIGDLARDFNEMVVKLKELEAMKRDFVAGVSHDFGTPLHAIKNALDMIQEGKMGPLTDKQAEYLLMMSNNTVQLTAFVENLLTSAKIEAAKSEPYYESLDAKTFAMDVINLYRSQAEKQGIELMVLNQGASPNIVIDATMFRQILSNLVSNAMKYTLKGSITIFLTEDTRNHIIKVKDTGIGIDPKNKELIFDKFFRVRQPKEFPERQGSGLGLSITKGLVEAMGGTIALDSRLGEGSTFTVRLPRRSPT